MRRGRPRTITDERRFAIWFASRHAPPAATSLTHWSPRALAAAFDVDHTTVAKLWQQWGRHPWRLVTLTRSTDPQFEATLRDVVGLYTSVNDLHAAIRTYIDAYDDRCEPFTWTMTADDILANSSRKQLQQQPTSKRGCSEPQAPDDFATVSAKRRAKRTACSASSRFASRESTG